MLVKWLEPFNMSLCPHCANPGNRCSIHYDFIDSTRFEEVAETGQWKGSAIIFESQFNKFFYDNWHFLKLSHYSWCCHWLAAVFGWVMFSFNHVQCFAATFRFFFFFFFIFLHHRWAELCAVKNKQGQWVMYTGQCSNIYPHTTDLVLCILALYIWTSVFPDGYLK